jgi:glycerate dehydrogenase
MKIIFLDSDTLPHPIERPSWATQWVNYPTTEQTTSAVVKALQDAEICITNKIRITPAILQACKNLRLICVAATGYDCIDMQACRERGVTVVNVPGYSSSSVAECVIANIFALRRNLLRYTHIGRERWHQSSHFCVHDRPILDIKDCTLGIFGYGAIGSRVATLASALGMNVLLAEHRGRSDIRSGYTRFEEVIARSDVLTLHCPLTPATTGMIGQAEVAHMKPGCVVINTSRGALINETALIDGLNSGHLAGAALDVLAVEPPLGTEAIFLCKHPNLLITPHIAWASQDGQAALAKGIEHNLNAFMAGQPVNVVS